MEIELVLSQVAPQEWENTPEGVKQAIELLLANQALLSQESYLVSFLDATPLGVAVHDATGRLVYLNQVGRALLGTERISAFDTSQIPALFQVYRRGTQEIYPYELLPSNLALAGRKVWAEDLEIRFEEIVIPLEVWATPVFDDQGRVIHVIVAFQDISERLRLEAERIHREVEQQVFKNVLLTSRHLCRQSIEARTDFVVRSQPDTTIIFANSSLCYALDQTLSEVLGKRWSSYMSAQDVEELEECIAKLTPANPTFTRIDQFYKANKQVCWIQWTNLGIFDAHGDLLEIQSVGQDVTILQKKIQREQGLNRVFQAVHNSLELETIFATAATETCTLLNISSCSVVQYFPDLGLWEHAAACQLCQGDSVTCDRVINLLSQETADRTNPLAEALKQLQVIQIPASEQPPNLPGAWLLIPLVVGGQLWGCFILSRQQDAVWHDDQVELAQAVTRQLEVAIQKAKLYQDLQLELEERRRVEAALRESEQRFLNVATNVPGVICRYLLRHDGSEAMLYMSPSCYNLWGVPAMEVIEDVGILWPLVHPEDFPALYSSMREAALAVKPWFGSWRITTPQGQEKWLQASYHPQPLENGDVVWDGLILDMSDRKYAELALQSSQRIIQKIAETSPCLLYIYDLAKHTNVYINPVCLSILGYTPQEIKNMGQGVLARICHPEDMGKISQHFQQISRLDDGEMLGLEYRIRRADGSWGWLYSQDTVFERDATGQVTQILGAARDVSDQKYIQTALEQSEQRFRTLFEATPKIAVQGYDRHRRVIYWNHASEVIYGYSKTEAIGRKLEELIIPDSMRQDVIDSIHHWLSTGTSIPPGELLLQRKDKSRIAVYSSHVILTNAEGEPELYCIDIDLSDHRRAEAARRESEARYRLLAENTTDLVCLHDLLGRYVYVSPSCELLLGYHYEEMLHRLPSDFIHPEDSQIFSQGIYQTMKGGRSAPITYRMRQRSGQYIWFETLTKPIVDASGQICQLQTTSRDITERIRVQSQLKYDALHDTLTRLPNRQLLMERLDLAISRIQGGQSDYQFAVLFLDLDRFKVVNDSLGHLAGDKLLIEIAKKLQLACRPQDLVARLGGDEFVILVEEIGGWQDAVHTAEQIFQQLRDPLIIAERQVYTTSSIGIVLGTKEYLQGADILRDADTAMYRAKANGKARYEIFDNQMHRQALARLHLENDLRRAIELKEFILHYQPVISLETGYLVGFEALIRWQHPEQGLKLPGDFIAIAEETGMITLLDYWALQTACNQMVAWQQTIPELANAKMSVNLSVQDLQHPDLISRVDLVLSQSNLDSHCLVLEITESMIIENVEAIIELLGQLQSRGLQISIDDFGTGYSSLSYLHRLPVNSLKIDRSFVNQLQTTQRNHKIVSTILGLSHQLELNTIAEGIETPEQLQYIKDLGCQFGQGYLISEPLDATEVIARIQVTDDAGLLWCDHGAIAKSHDN